MGLLHMFLGIDLGTSGIRVLLVNAEGRAIVSAEVAIKVSHPHIGWSEQDPSIWIAALEKAVGKLKSSTSAFSQVKGIGVSGQMHGATLLDSRDQVIRPCILWNDTRSHLEAAELESAANFRDISGNIVFPGFTVPKLEWLRKNEPNNYSRIAKVLLPAAFLNFYLTRDHVADMSDSSGTSWLDTRKRAWSLDLLAAGNMREDQMPRLVEGSEPAGKLCPELSQKWGLPGDVIIAGGAGDNAAAACGTGVLAEGQGFVSLGTSGVVLAARDTYRPNPDSAVHTFCHAIPNCWYQMGVMLSATDSINWLSSIIGKTPRQLTKPLGDTLQAAGRIRFLPYLSGERTPHNDAAIRGAFMGLGSETSTEDMTRAVLEGVAFGLRDSAEALKATGAKLEHMLAIGGGTASRYWVKLLATVLGTPLYLPKSSEFGAALGAARLAICATTGADARDIMSSPETFVCVAPEASLIETYDQAYVAFRASYPRIKEVQ